MNVFDAVRTVLAVRSYQDKPIPSEVVHRIVEAGRLTGSSMNLQPWHFIVVEERETLEALGAMARTPLAVIVAVEKTQFGVSDGSRAIQSMVLTAWEAGIGSNWIGFSGMLPVNALLAIPDELEILAVLAFGYPAKELGKGVKNRKPLSQVAHRGRFGQPYTTP